MLEEKILKVSELSTNISNILANSIGSIWLEGEISNLTKAPSGHFYFSIKDEFSQIKAAMFKGIAAKLTFTPKVGETVLILSEISLYKPRGDLQLIVKKMQPKGLGQLQQALENLKKKLLAEGLFASGSKKIIPKYPRNIAVITSEKAAALQDVLNVITRRAPQIIVTVYPTLVQGAQAPAEILNALNKCLHDNKADVIILCRGGGSLEDLMAFNDEALIRAIYAADIPIISGVGHEIDFTLSDLVADLRAPTPSAAAELATYNSIEVKSAIVKNKSILTKYITKVLYEKMQHIDLLLHKIPKPKQQLEMRYLVLSNYFNKINKLFNCKILAEKEKLNLQMYNLKKQHPRYKFQQLAYKVDNLKSIINNIFFRELDNNKNVLLKIIAQLNAFSPKKTLKRGYSICLDMNGKIVKSKKHINKGDILEIQFNDGNSKTKAI